MQVAFYFNACNKLEQNNFNSIAAMKINNKINNIFEFNSSNRSSADTNVDRRYQPSGFIKVIIKAASSVLSS